MDLVKKQKWLTWAVIVLAVMNISTWGTLIYHHYFTSELTPAYVQGTQDNISLSGRFFRQQLQWDEEQMNQFRRIHPHFRQQVQDILAHMNRHKYAMLNIMRSDSCDTLRLNALSDSIGYWHSQLKRATYCYYFELKKICRPDQRSQLDQIFTRLLTNDSQASMGGGHRRRMQHPMHQQGNSY
ncbi:MAG: Spy/CpxP family protein refolding chaperone [Bacteroidales bacterium]